MTNSRVIDAYPRETIDFIPFRGLLVNGYPPAPASVSYAVVPDGSRPATWSPAVQVGTTVGFLLNGPVLGRGVYTVFARVDSSPGPVVLELGQIRLT